MLQPACATWGNLDGEARTGRNRAAVAAQASVARTAFEQADRLDSRAGLGDAVTSLAFLDALQEPGQASATDTEVAHAVATVDDACRPYR